jgi:hypothetical protein
MPDQYHYHFLRTPAGEYICIDISSVGGEVYYVSWFTNRDPMGDSVDLTPKCRFSKGELVHAGR